MNSPQNWPCKILLLGFLLALSACTQTAFTVANLPTHLVEMAIEYDQAYGPEPSQKLDMYVPAAPKDKHLDVIVFFMVGAGPTEPRKIIGLSLQRSHSRTLSSSFPIAENIPRCASRHL